MQLKIHSVVNSIIRKIIKCVVEYLMSLGIITVVGLSLTAFLMIVGRSFQFLSSYAALHEPIWLQPGLKPDEFGGMVIIFLIVLGIMAEALRRTLFVDQD